MNRLRLLIFAALMVSIGGQWMALQGVAWLGMAVAYSVESGSVSDGLSKTFDGQHPCALCKAVEKGSQEENDPALPFGGKSLVPGCFELYFADALRLFPPTASRLELDWRDQKATVRMNAPDGPPPRTV